jgi:Uma2 family endonuclease
MSAAALPRKRFTRDEVDQMTALGLFADQRLELIEGDLINKMGQHPPHTAGLQYLLELLAEIFGLRRVRSQLPMEVALEDRRYNFPEPDLAVIAEMTFPIGERHPAGGDTLVVVEVADSTLRGDLTIKRDLYARAGVPEYWVLNVKDRKLVVHREPRDGKNTTIETLGSSESVSIAGHSLRVADMLP